MTIALSCGQCGKRYELDGKLAGKRARCKQCGHEFTIPVPRQTTPSRPKSTAAATAPLNAYGIDEEPAVSRKPKSSGFDPFDDLGNSTVVDSASEDDFGNPVLTRAGAPPKKKKKKKSGSGSGFQLPDLTGKVVLFGLVALGILAALSFVSKGAGMIFLILTVLIGMVMILTGGVWTLVSIVRESVVCFLLWMFVPFYSLYYLITRWEDMKGPFCTVLGGYAFLLGGMFIATVSGNLSDVNAPPPNAAMANNGNPFAPAIAGNPAPPFVGNIPRPPAGINFPVRPPGGINIHPPIIPPNHAAAEAASARDRMVYELNYRSLARAMDRTRTTLSRIQDAQTIPLSMPLIDASLLTLNSARDRVKSLPAPSPDQLSELRKSVGAQVRTAATQLKTEVERVERFPELQGKLGNLKSDLDQVLVTWAPLPGENPAVPDPVPALATAESLIPLAPPSGGTLDTDPVTRSLVELKSTKSYERVGAVQRLERLDPDDRLPDVNQALTALLDDDDAYLVSQTIKALAVWKTDQTVPNLIRKLRDNRPSVRYQAIDTLGELKDIRAAEALAERLDEDSFKARPALIALGSAAEPSVIALLSDPQSKVRREACQVLQEIGTHETLKAMATLPPDTDSGVRNAAKDAITKITARVGPLPKSGADGPAPPTRKRRKL